MVIAHRGASGQLPEQTLEAFQLAVDQGADAVEFDVVPTRDGVLLARHESELSATTNVAEHGEFASRRRTRTIDGTEVTGWFADEFSADEIRRLKARQRFAFRDASHDDHFSIPTLDDVLAWRAELPRRIGLFIEIKHPTHYRWLGLLPAELLLPSLSRHGLLGPDSGVVLMSFETQVLRELRAAVDLPLIQLLDSPDSRPFDWTVSGQMRSYADLLTPTGLAEIATYANGIGPWKGLIIPSSAPDDAEHVVVPSSLIADAHAAGLFTCAWTFRDEPQYLSSEHAGNAGYEYARFIELGLDGFITDFAATAVAAIGVVAGQDRRHSSDFKSQI